MMNQHRNGQALILTILSIGGAIMGATAIAGLLMLYQIRATTDAINSASAIFAADTGINWALFDYFCGITSTANPNSRCIAGYSGEQPFLDAVATSGILVNGARAGVNCYDASFQPVLCSDTARARTAVSIGNSLNSKRAFSLDFERQATST